MEKTIIFGAGGTGQKVYSIIKKTCTVCAFVDNSTEKWGTDIDGIPVKPPEQLPQLDYDVIQVATLTGLNDILIQLQQAGIPGHKINSNLLSIWVNSRIFFLERFAQMAKENKMQGNVAEAGVYQGAFAKEINKNFSDRTLYLFDTFDGFDLNDIEDENKASLVKASYLKNTAEDLVLQKMPHPSMCKIFKGRFPETAADVEDTFCFVNLDMDLYTPTLKGLEFFYPKMVSGGIILIHDYFSNAYPNVKQAVADFETAMGKKLQLMPIGDDISIAVLIP